jgi:uroporphyrinogen decarboxylase
MTGEASGKKLIHQAFACKKTVRPPWVPFVGCHAGFLIGASAEDYLKSSSLIVKGINESINRYKPDGIPVAFDLQIEAEILGCELVWSKETPPSVASHPLANGKKLSDLKIPQPSDGRLPVVLEACSILRKAHPELALYGLITGPFTLALHLRGTDIFMMMFDEPEKVKELMQFCETVCNAMSEYYIRAGCDVIALVDPMTSQIGPEQFNQFVQPFALNTFQKIREKGALSSFFVCGQAQQNVEAMCGCKPDNISVDENIPLNYVREVCLKRGVSFGGNLQLTVVLLLGSQDDTRRHAVECMEIGGSTGYVLSPGCDLPYSTPPANLEAVAEMVFDSYKREVVKAMKISETEEEKLNLSDYGQSDKIIVDIITLDSESCAPCQYMVEAVKKVAPHFEGIVEWREHKIKYKDSLKFMTSLMVKNVPTICIDGKIKFVSRIPPRDELVAAIQERINEKLRFKIKRRKATLYILGKTREECHPMQQAAQQAVNELGVEVNISLVMDEKRILSYGAIRTPAIVLARYSLKAEGQVPDVAIIKEWLKDL